MRYREVREEIVAVAKQMFAEGLVKLTMGNLSRRILGENLLAITPARRPYNTMKPEEVPIITLDGGVVEGEFRPSSEAPMHTLIMRERPEVNAVIHTHSPYALALAIAHKELPTVCLEGLAARAPKVLVAEYAVPGTEEIGQKALETLNQQHGSLAVLLANHGLLTIGASLAEAYAVASRVETQAMVYQLALNIGTPVSITPQQIQAIRSKYEKKKE